MFATQTSKPRKAQTAAPHASGLRHAVSGKNWLLVLVNEQLNRHSKLNFNRRNPLPAASAGALVT